MVEVITGLPPGRGGGHGSSTEYDPTWRTLMKREAAKVAELAAGGQQISKRTFLRMLQRYEAAGLGDWWTTGTGSRRLPDTGRTDERVVKAVTEALAGQTDLVTGDRKRLMLQAQQKSFTWHNDRVEPTIRPDLHHHWCPGPALQRFCRPRAAQAPD
ncbi:hypothetical protein [Streptomyces deccanensis]|uniref:hypothetical protein n=1 Tax=Streptomyces deccanensis TaxID=424188 RepID=UPI001EFC0A84|nr:hypothetical protein [Streptomyces deccanensis]ULR48441.1 hypothetical protein L3078_03625 [Streptomyces deccanensis]